MKHKALVEYIENMCPIVIILTQFLSDKVLQTLEWKEHLVLDQFFKKKKRFNVSSFCDKHYSWISENIFPAVACGSTF